MGYSKAFREGLGDAAAKLRWRMEVHLRSHLLPHPEDSPSTRGELSKALVVLADCFENFVTEVAGYLRQELATSKAGGRAAPKPPARAGGRSRAASRKKPATAKRRRR